MAATAELEVDGVRAGAGGGGGGTHFDDLDDEDEGVDYCHLPRLAGGGGGGGAVMPGFMSCHMFLALARLFFRHMSLVLLLTAIAIPPIAAVTLPHPSRFMRPVVVRVRATVCNVVFLCTMIANWL